MRLHGEVRDYWPAQRICDSVHEVRMRREAIAGKICGRLDKGRPLRRAVQLMSPPQPLELQWDTDCKSPP